MDKLHSNQGGFQSWEEPEAFACSAINSHWPSSSLRSLKNRSRWGLLSQDCTKRGLWGVLGIHCLQGPAPAPVAKQNKQKTSRAGLGNHQLKQIYIPDAPRNVSGASGTEGRTNSLEKRKGCRPRGATFFFSALWQASTKGPKIRVRSSNAVYSIPRSPAVVLRLAHLGPVSPGEPLDEDFGISPGRPYTYLLVNSLLTGLAPHMCSTNLGSPGKTQDKPTLGWCCAESYCGE